MATTEKQRRYNQKSRQKRNKIAGYCNQLNRLESSLGRLPRCAVCQRENRRCEHTKERRNLQKELELVRTNLRDLEH